jgi:hypothetical protein
VFLRAASKPQAAGEQEVHCGATQPVCFESRRQKGDIDEKRNNPK